MAHSAEPLIRDKSIDIPSEDLRPHYSDARFVHDRIGYLTVFLAEGAEPYDTPSGHAEVRGLRYLHSTVVARSVDFDKRVAAWNHARQEIGSESSVLFFERYLARVLDRDSVDIQHILSTVNIGGDGNPSQYFGIIEP